MNGTLLIWTVIAVGLVLLVLAAMISALHSASRPRGAARHHSYHGDGGSSAWSGWSGGDGGGSCGAGDGGGGGGGC